MTYYERNREDRLAYQTAYAIKTRDRRYEWNREYYRKKRIILGKLKNPRIEAAKRARKTCPTCNRIFKDKFYQKHQQKVLELFNVPKPIERESDFLVHII